MATSQLGEVVQYLRRTVLWDGSGVSDAKLLDSFVRRRDDAALAALVRRHGPMVWRVCRRILYHHQDAEDAFQATFLVLVRKATAIQQGGLVGSWLYGVAHKTALKARALAGKRSLRETQVAELPERPATNQQRQRELQSLLDQELSSLPEKYRVLLVLCDLEGRTRREVADQLGCPEGTVAGRLARARALLARRLGRYGLPISGGALATALASDSACLSASLYSATITAASQIAAGQAANGLVSPPVAAPTEGVLQTMWYSKIKAAMTLLLCLLAGTGLVFAAGQTPGTSPAETSRVASSQSSALDALWKDLASTDEGKASRALLAFAARPAEATAFLKEHLRPVKLDADHLKKLIDELGDEKYAVRESASRKLATEVEYLGAVARPVLEKSMESARSAEVKRRIEGVLKRLPAQADPARPAAGLPGLQGKSVAVTNINGQVHIVIDGKPLDLSVASKPAAPPKPNTQWLRAARAVSLLETFRTAQARAVLETLAGGQPEARPTQEARAALKRLESAKIKSLATEL